MSKRLGYETTHVMLNLHRKMNKQMNADPELNKSALVNGLLFKWFEGKLCPHCFSPNIVHHTCQKCGAPYIVCKDEEKPDGREYLPATRERCDCTVREMYFGSGE
jgi:hypothetical protein